ncbi:antiviral RADAR system adenosine triphosphatase RdrA [Photobacterium leiognathi]|uniref:antiviral RADAR system adenosine triphosphatase RdrA n=1 Tax=Photobacterium leiognathi TaxID=553611 RepID=UPI002980BEA3|nr:antiviral RADAR system adenosine triphosphatase RdrA [Photobacterium leiognathi]
MTNILKLNYTKAEYLDDYSDSSGEFWQYEAQESLINKLEITLREAKEYKENRKQDNNKTWLSHNAILVSGQRGTGKTVFLRNCEKLWIKACKKKNPNNIQEEELKFLNVIDPTMLVNNDHFSNVIIAQIYYVVEKKIKSSSGCNSVSSVSEQEKTHFYNSLKKLADALGKKDDFNGHSGIDKILQYNSGIQIESYFHLFIESAINLLGCKALVLPIDDVDMALGRAFEVVDDVRRLLGCPYIIPIVSGDMRLYEQMTNVHFDKNAYDNESKNEDLIAEGILVSKELTTSYLTKVFPNQMRIGLRPIPQIIQKLRIISDFNDDELIISEYYNLIFNRFYFLCSNEEAINHWPEPESARELTQLVRSINPEILSHKSNDIIWRDFQNWAEQKKNGVAFTNAMSWLSLNNLDVEIPFNIESLISFNPKMQMDKDRYPWAKKDFVESQIEAVKSMASVSKQLSAQQNGNLSIIESAYNKNNYTLRSMPPHEFFDDKKYVTQGAIKNTRTSLDDEKKDNANILLDVYTYGDYYSTLSNTYQYVFCSRAFELILFSFVNKSLDVEKDIYNILGRRPFYSIFNSNPTKVIQDGDSEEELEKTKDSKVESSRLLAQKINTWKADHATFFNEMNTSDLISIFSYMFNKTFSALHLYKFKSNKSYPDEHLTDLARRFELTLVNSAMTALIKDNAINANVALTDNYNTLRNYNEFVRYDRVITRNEDILNNESNDNHYLKVQFIKVLWGHPIFEINNSKGTLETLFSLGRGELESKLVKLRKDFELKDLKLVSALKKRLDALDEKNKNKLDTFIKENNITSKTSLVEPKELNANLLKAIQLYIEGDDA